MQTVEQRLHAMLIQRGLFEKQAHEIMAAVKAAPESEAMRGRWEEPESGYHPAVIAGLCVAVCAHAVKWIDRNAPDHWTRPVFLFEST
jgi:hypothetical protein